jgi:hypothetical protein
MKPSPAACPSDGPCGARAGIAQYNRDFLSALAEAGAVSSITVVPRHGARLSCCYLVQSRFCH